MTIFIYKLIDKQFVADFLLKICVFFLYGIDPIKSALCKQLKHLKNSNF